MAKITITAPCQRIHRFLLPPHSKHVVYHAFDGGAIVLAKILGELLVSRTEKLFSSWDTQLEDWKKGNEPLPDRFIKLAPFAPAPSLRKHLKPGTLFLRVQEKEDGEMFNENVQAPFSFDAPQAKRSVAVIGGIHPEQAWNSIETPDIVYLLAKSATAIREHCRFYREKFPTAKSVLVGQIELADLAKHYPLQTDTSYERIIGDICRAEFKPAGEPSCTLVSYLVGGGALEHLIIRIGNAACLIVSRKQDGAGESLDLNLCYQPERSAPTSFPGLGSMLAYDLLLSSAIVHKLAGSDFTEQISSALVEGAEVAVQATYRCFCEGFGLYDADQKPRTKAIEKKARTRKNSRTPAKPAEDPDSSPEGLTKICAHGLFVKYMRHGLTVQKPAENQLSVIPGVTEPVPAKSVVREVHYETACSPNRFWRMAVPGPDGASEENCKRVAKYHLQGTSDKPLPIVEIGKHKLVDRHEVEDYLFLQRLLIGYHGDSNRKQPLSIGVFGQPGGGKSFGVKQLVQEMSGGSENFSTEDITINLSQLRSLDELADGFHKIRNACLRGPIPLVFFDEFDAGFEGQAFGWLKYFLAPMQDGNFVQKGNTYHFGKAIFVFAGGINHAFSEFNERARNPEFCDAKGPDFISRLRGILNIKGMNRPDGDGIEHIYMIRRAVYLRDQLKKRLGKSTEELVSEHMIEALLSIPRFKHGVRSMEAILDMSSLEPGQSFTHSHLPPRSQLDMHVDAREFLRLAGVLVPLDKG